MNIIANSLYDSDFLGDGTLYRLIIPNIIISPFIASDEYDSSKKAITMANKKDNKK